jgi:hypothetical protein
MPSPKLSLSLMLDGLLAGNLSPEAVAAFESVTSAVQNVVSMVRSIHGL